ncbi:MAG: AAA family ATPase [Clostridia bacterium]|nr:AAA family ATPase [Clostridia bacterium]
MKLISFSVTNYRSITTAHKIDLSNLTVLVGKNNEGKSNLLTALNTAMSVIMLNADSRMSSTGMYLRRFRLWDRGDYDWERDFPLQFQNRKRGLESIFNLIFRLEGKEVEEFHNETHLRGNEDIPIRIKFGRYRKYEIEVPKKGSSSYNKKSAQIMAFISKRISFNYIKAVRTENMAMEALMDIIKEELSGLENNPEYNKAQAKIMQLQNEVLNKISRSLIEPLKVFLPNITDVKIVKDAKPYLGRSYTGDFDVIINDGTPTSINFKGDGIKSLVSLAILKERRTTKSASIIAIEEPESHLHSGAIHSLCEVINKISENSQVILTTHNPLFVQQNYINSNIVVDKGKAYPAKNVAEIREILGVLPADNLKNANKVLVVEGEDDVISLSKILPLKSEKIARALKNNTLIIQPLHGVSNLSHLLFDLKRSLCKYVALLDNDKAGKDAFDKASKEGLISPSEVKFTICNGIPEAEFEDCIKTSSYENLLFNKFGVQLNCKEFKGKSKWSDRLKNVFLSQGSQWNDQIEKKVKNLIAENLPNDLNEILISQKSGFIDGLVTIIEAML